MQTLLFSGAGGLAAIWLVLHLFTGGPQIARPLMNAMTLEPVARHTMYLCWHFTSAAIACMSVFFGWAAIEGDMSFAIAGTALASGFCVVGIGLVLLMKEKHAELPQGWLFLPVAALGFMGLLV